MFMIKMSRQNVLIRIIICILLIALVYFTIYSCKTNSIPFIIINSISIVILVIFFFNPTYLYYLSFLGFLYNFAINFYFPEEHCSIIFFTIGTMSLAILGIYHYHKKIKIAITTIIYFLSILTEIRFGKEIFLEALYKKFLYTLAFLIVSILCYIYTTQIINTREKKILSLDSLNLSDAELIVFYLITKNYKFETIATYMRYSLSSVKRIAKKLYTILDVPDLICFNAKIGRYEIIYPKNFKIPKP